MNTNTPVPAPLDTKRGRCVGSGSLIYGKRVDFWVVSEEPRELAEDEWDEIVEAARYLLSPKRELEAEARGRAIGQLEDPR